MSAPCHICITRSHLLFLSCRLNRNDLLFILNLRANHMSRIIFIWLHLINIKYYKTEKKIENTKKKKQKNNNNNHRDKLMHDNVN